MMETSGHACLLHLGSMSPYDAFESVALLRVCAEDRSDEAAWTTLLARLTPRIRHFIRGTIDQICGRSQAHRFLQGGSENDLLQEVIVRLVERDCAVLKRFSGTGEPELLAYLAVISRSVVRDSLRRSRALKRGAEELPLSAEHEDRPPHGSVQPVQPIHGAKVYPLERKILARELSALGLEAIDRHSGAFSARDRLIFELFYHGELTTEQIARAEGVGLSRRGVEKVIHRVTSHLRRTFEGNRGEALPL